MAILQNSSVGGTLSATSLSGPGGSITGFNTSIITSQLPQTVATSGTVINRTDYTNSTRIGLSSAASYQIYSFTITKISSTSSLWIKGIIPMSGEDAGSVNSGLGFYIGVDGVNDYTGIAADNLDSQGCGVHLSQLRTGISSGSRTITFGWSTADGQAIKPSTSVNNTTYGGEGRNRQQGTVITVWELA